MRGRHLAPLGVVVVHIQCRWRGRDLGDKGNFAHFCGQNDCNATEWQKLELHRAVDSMLTHAAPLCKRAHRGVFCLILSRLLYMLCPSSQPALQLEA